MKKLTLATMFLLSTFSLIAASGIFQTYIIIDIDGTGNSYYAGGANDDGATAYAGMTITPNSSFILNGGEVKTWKNGGSDITAAYIYYRLYKEGNTPPSFTGILLPWAENLPDTDGDQKWTRTNANVDIRQAIIDLNQGIGNYILEVYWQANSSDGTHLDDNGGNYFSATINVTAPFPVVLSHFSAKKSKSAVDIQWTTQSEINNDYFELEKSKDGADWKLLTMIEGQANSNRTINYDFIDEQPYSGNNYYRLRQVDLDGKSTLSSIEKVVFEDLLTQNVLFPNPASEYIHFKLPNYNNGYTLQIWDAQGRKLISKNQVRNNQSLNISNLQTNIYYWRIEHQNGQTYSGKLIKE